MTIADQIKQLENEISDIQRFHRCFVNGEEKFFTTVGSAREAIKGRRRKIEKLRADNPFPDVMSSSNC